MFKNINNNLLMLFFILVIIFMLSHNSYVIENLENDDNKDNDNNNDDSDPCSETTTVLQSGNKSGKHVANNKISNAGANAKLHNKCLFPISHEDQIKQINERQNK